MSAVEDVNINSQQYKQLIGLGYPENMVIKQLQRKQNETDDNKQEHNEADDEKGVVIMPQMFQVVPEDADKALPKDPKESDINDIINKLEKDEFIQKKGIENIHLILFVHGFANDDNDVKERLDEIDTELGTNEIVTTAYNWKCNEKSFWKISEYKQDEKRVEGNAYFFVDFIEKLRGKGFKKLDIVCHSMGNYLFTLFIEQCKTLKKCLEGSQIVTFAADVEIKRFENAVKRVQNAVKDCKWTHYYNTRDHALDVSQMEHSDLWKLIWDGRAGKQSVHSVDSIECDNIYQSILDKDVAKHSYIDNPKLLEDLKALLMDGKGPDSKERGYLKKKENEPRVW
eukprot:453590_1